PRLPLHFLSTAVRPPERYTLSLHDALPIFKEHLNRIPADSSPTTIAMHSTMLAPWLADRPETITRAELDARTARPLTDEDIAVLDRKSTRLNSSHVSISYAVFCLKKKTSKN